MALPLVASLACHPSSVLLPQGQKWGQHRMTENNLCSSRTKLGSSFAIPLNFGKSLPCNHLQRIDMDDRMHTIRALSSGEASSNKSEDANVDSVFDKTREELKKLVMQSVTNTNRGKTATNEQRLYIFSLLQELESQNPTIDPVNSPLFSGRWALLYTAPVDEKTSDKYAGTEEGPFLSRVKPASFGTVRQSRSFQVIDAVRGTAENIAEFTFLGTQGSLIIFGSVTKSPATEKGAVRVDVTFDSFVVKLGSVTFPSVSLNWISPKGWIETTFLDENFRIGRGDKGSIFVAVRAK
ncbi:probable plastid-lipid-associated protein 4, chloroplastic isoform X1 [Physcomitrium patens]|uniref:Plastid lipid-associated protein/fibrillin conserved domain-containing protein n=1 Tax=Physcomitrium patens TaxID=3218 RepID=A9TR92_PHYPA|nr:probable plastid-lipid-associated protein 4, chloroplastic isoform X1 [Physcomitrium patens]|eukprot:XP_024369799.1 probable plastid-lipid-associated protein 4, chloroplastic isoform X1 [Physcomitrella patens]